MNDFSSKYGKAIRKPIVDSNGWIEVEVSADGQAASLKQIDLRGDLNTRPEQVVHTLRQAFLLKGFYDLPLINRCLTQAKSNDEGLEGAFPIVKGSAPVSKNERLVHFCCLDGLANSQTLPFADLKSAFLEDSIDAVLVHGVVTRMVRPHEPLARLGSVDVSVDGQDVFGHCQRGSSGPSVVWQAGDNVTLEDGVYTADIFGYVCISGLEISVIDPIWISPDFSAAYYVFLPQIGAQCLPQPSWILDNLAHREILRGVDHQMIRQLCYDVLDRQEAAAFLIAEASVPEPLEEAQVTFTFDPDQKPGTLADDGSIDFQEQNTVVAVKQDQLLAEIIPAKGGGDGFDLKGEIISGEVGEEITLKAGENVRVEVSEDGHQHFYAEADGNVRIMRDSLVVRQGLEIFGDVDYSLGNIEAGKDVIIKGTVRTGFQVKAGGDILIGGAAENGAVIRAQGDVVISRGIIGEKTKVVALGNVQTKFIQNSTVMARGNVEVGNYILNATVRSGDSIIVHSRGGRRAGMIAGGCVLASHAIETRIVGAPMVEKTEIGITSDMETEAQLKKLEHNIDYCQNEILRRFRTLGIRDLTEGEIKRLLNKTPQNKRQHVSTVLKQLQELVLTREQAFEQKQELQDQQAEIFEEARLQIRGRIVPDVLIRFGELSHRISDRMQGAIFKIEEDEIVW